MHGGTSRQQRRPGQGSDFLVRIPIDPAVAGREAWTGGDDAEPRASSVRAARCRRQRGRATDPAMMLLRWGTRCTRLRTALEALESAATIMPALILMDIGMPR